MGNSKAVFPPGQPDIVQGKLGWAPVELVVPKKSIPRGKECATCDAEVQTYRHTYCEACGTARRKQTTRSKDNTRMKPCIRCGGPKEHVRGSRFCASCREALQPAWQRAERERGRAKSNIKARGNPKRHKRWDAPDGTKWCNRCEQYRPYVDFGAHRTHKDGLATYCIPCSSAYLHEHNLKKLFNMTVDQYVALLEYQNGCCAICLKKPRSRRLAVDHNHKTGQVRGLLCSRCNHKLLGASNEDAALLRRAADYLTTYASMWEPKAEEAS